MKEYLKRISMILPQSGLKAKFLLKYYERNGMQIGENAHFFSTTLIGEPYLVSIGNNSTVANNVAFMTHDASIGAIENRNVASDLCGRISIGNNCFIGYGSIIMYGVSIPDRVIVAAGSVVTRSVTESGVIIGGNPAKVIGSISEFKNKYGDKFISLHGLDVEQRRSEIEKNEYKLIKK